jgi:hypothetical protein
MRDRILAFLADMDQWLQARVDSSQGLDLFVIGKSAVILFFGGERSGALTSDVDVVLIGGAPDGLLREVLAGFGKHGPGHTAHGLYLEVVACGLPPMPQGFQSRCQIFQGGWSVLRIWQPDPNDLAASKLKRFEAKDRQDLRHLVDYGFLEPARLQESLAAAFAFESGDSPVWETACENLETVLAYLRGDSRSI